MKIQNSLTAMLLWAMTAAGATAQSGATPEASATDTKAKSFVLVRAANDSEQIQTGQVIDDGARYEIRLGERSSLWVPRHQVLFIGESIEDVYQYRVKRVIHWGVGDHFQMSRWCLQHGLVSQAAEHYTKVARLHPRHASVKQLGIEMQEKMLEDDGFRQFLGLAAPARATRLATPEENAQNGATNGVVPASTASLSPLLLQHFSQSIQPILKNRCSQAACHGYRTKTGLQIIHPYGEKASSITAKNLSGVKKFLKLDSAGDPELVRYAITAHGPARSPAIAENETALIQELLSFSAIVQTRVVPAVARSGDAGVVQANGQLPHPAPVRPQPVPAGAQQLRPMTQSEGELPASVDKKSLMQEIEELDRQLRNAAQASGDEKSSDPFDADEFNAKRRQKLR